MGDNCRVLFGKKTPILRSFYKNSRNFQYFNSLQAVFIACMVNYYPIRVSFMTVSLYCIRICRIRFLW